MIKSYFLLEHILRELNPLITGTIVDDVVSYRKNEVEIRTRAGRLIVRLDRDWPWLGWQMGPSTENAVRIWPEFCGAQIERISIVNQQRFIRLGAGAFTVMVNLYSGATGISLYREEKRLYSVKHDVDRLSMTAQKPSDHIYKGLRDWAPDLDDSDLISMLFQSDTLFWCEDAKGRSRIGLIDPPSDWHVLEASTPIFDAYQRIVPRIIQRQKNDTLRTELIQAINQQKTRIQSTIAKLEKLLSQPVENEKWQQFGHLILNHAHEIQAHDTELMVPNIFTDATPVRIPLKADLSPAENAERYYRKSGSGDRNRQTAEVRLNHARKQESVIERLNSELAEARRYAELMKIKKQCIIEGWLKAETAREERLHQSRNVDAIEIEIDGHTVLIGKDAASNDVLSRKIAKANDYWFHVQGSPGSHVVLRWQGNKDNPPKDLLEKIASVTAYYSKQKNAGTIPVIYTLAKYVRKPKGAKPGAVIVQYEKSIFVKPLSIEDVQGGS